MRGLAVLVLLSVLGWAAFAIFVALDLFKTTPQVLHLISVAGMVVTTITCVGLIATVILGLVLRDIFQVEPNGLIRALIYSGLTFAASFILLSYFGVDVGALLTTSAILGAVVGLSMQATLGSIISGLSMSAEPLLKIGSGIRFDDRTVIIEQKTWRHVIGRRLDGVRIIIPNSTLANMPVQVLPEDGPERFEVFLHLPPNVPPQRISDLLSKAFGDMDHIDTTRAVEITPIETQPEVDSILYRVRLWARDYTQIAELRGEVLRRAWYVLDRAGIHQPRNLFFEAPRRGKQKQADLANIIAARVLDLEAQHLEGKIRQYRFAPSELLCFPHDDLGRRMMILRGEASSETSIYLNPLEHGRSARPFLPTLRVQQLSTLATFRQIADLLAQYVGPVAEKLVQEGIKVTQNGSEFLHHLAENIHDEAPREDFLAEATKLLKSDVRRGPGTVATLNMDAAGQITTDPEFRTLTEVLAVTFPEHEAATLQR